MSEGVQSPVFVDRRGPAGADHVAPAEARRDLARARGDLAQGARRGAAHRRRAAAEVASLAGPAPIPPVISTVRCPCSTRRSACCPPRVTPSGVRSCSNVERTHCGTAAARATFLIRSLQRRPLLLLALSGDQGSRGRPPSLAACLWRTNDCPDHHDECGRAGGGGAREVGAAAGGRPVHHPRCWHLLRCRRLEGVADAVFADAGRSDIRRHPNPHLVFGRGPPASAWAPTSPVHPDAGAVR